MELYLAVLLLCSDPSHCALGTTSTLHVTAEACAIELEQQAQVWSDQGFAVIGQCMPAKLGNLKDS